MKTFIIASIMFGLGALGVASEADAGCVKDAIIGGIAGHLVGHGGLGAAAGCAYGVHENHKYERQQTNEGRSSYDQQRDNGRY